LVQRYINLSHNMFIVQATAYHKIMNSSWLMIDKLFCLCFFIDRMILFKETILTIQKTTISTEEKKEKKEEFWDFNFIFRKNEKHLG
jgi:hypothetical protein